MNPKLFALLPALALAGIALFLPSSAPAGDVTSASGYKVLEPIRHGNLTVFPVVTARSHDTQELLTLDEGLRSGDVIVTESGSVQPLDAAATDPDPARRTTGESTGAGQQLQTAADSAGGRDRDRRETGPGDRQRPHCPGRKRSHRPRGLLRRARALDRPPRTNFGA